jgi:hypothetical protein
MEVLKRVSTNRLTLRLQSDLLETLKQNADKKDLTLNAMITNILNKNATYDETVNVVPNMIIPHDLFLNIVSKIREPDMHEIVKNGPNVVKKLFDIMGLPYDIDHVIYNYLTMLSKYCNWFELTHKITGTHYRLVFCTGNDSKWSTFVQQYIRTILESLKIIITNESHHAGIIVFEFSHRDYL